MTGPFEALIQEMDERGDRQALAFGASRTTYASLAAAAARAYEEFVSAIPVGSVVMVIDEFSVESVARMLGLAAHQCTVVPVSTLGATQVAQIRMTSRAQFLLPSGQPAAPLDGDGQHPMYEVLRDRGAAGLVLFSSGSTGEPKGAVHDFDRLLVNMPSRPMEEVLLAFLLFDHIGGINTLLRTLRGGAQLVMPDERSPDSVASAIEEHGVTVLPTSPSFLAMLLASGAVNRHELTTLRVVTYGTEVMPEALLRRVSERLPNVRLKQTYGLSEVGILSTQSESNESTWVRLGGDGFQVRVVDGMLEVKSDSGMLGYLNAPTPYTADGWFQTFDEVEVRGDLFRILGRKSEMINVGGLKVFPQEVESALLDLPFIDDCVVFGRTHPLSGQIVAAEIVLTNPDEISTADARSAIRRALRASLDAYKVPAEVTLVDKGRLVSARFKKTRTARD